MEAWRVSDSAFGLKPSQFWFHCNVINLGIDENYFPKPSTNNKRLANVRCQAVE